MAGGTSGNDSEHVECNVPRLPITLRRTRTNLATGAGQLTPPKLPAVAWINEPSPEALIRSAWRGVSRGLTGSDVRGTEHPDGVASDLKGAFG
jgi:hypothetical protein